MLSTRKIVSTGTKEIKTPARIGPPTLAIDSVRVMRPFAVISWSFSTRLGITADWAAPAKTARTEFINETT